MAPADSSVELLNAGVAAHRAGRLKDAEKHYRAVLASDPVNADALNLLGALAGADGRADEAISLIQKAAKVRPEVATFRFNLGVALCMSGRFMEAIDPLQAALRLQPVFVEAEFALGQALRQVHRHSDAAVLYRRVLAREPGHRDAWKGLIHALELQGAVAEAETQYQSYLKNYPGDDAMRHRWATLLPPIAQSKGDVARWRERFEHGLTDLLSRALRIDDPLNKFATTNFFLTYHGFNNARLAALAARVLVHAHPELQWTSPACVKWRGSGRRIKVGFISKFMQDHSIGRTTRGLVEQLSRERFETFALFVPPYVRDEYSEAIGKHADRALTLPASLDQAREQIAALGLDVLFYQDIGMEPYTYFLAFSRLAPVQCVSFGHPDTTGIPAMDYFVSNDLFELEGAQEHYTERLFLLHDLPTLAYYHKPRLPSTPLARAAFGLPQDRRLYLCPQTLFKIHPDFDDTLLMILRDDDHGMLVLVQPQVSQWLQLLLLRLEAKSPGVSRRIVAVPVQPREQFLSLLSVADVVLDTPQFNGMNSSLEAFAVGTPVVTMPGELQRSRHTQAMYRSMQIDDLIVHTPEEYARTAVAIAQDPQRREELRRRIMASHDVLFENVRVVREFERFFETAVAERAHRNS